MAQAAKSLRVLLTIQSMEGPAGGSLYVRDFAQELFRLGHHPVVYCLRLGALAAQVRHFGIPVCDSLDKLARPDIIHGNSPIETAAVLLRFPDVPAIFVCHGWDSPDALAPRFPNVMRYLAVSEISRDRLIFTDGVPEDRIAMHLNPVDLLRFPRRPPLPPRPARALFFSNTMSPESLALIRQACDEYGLPLDVLGEAAGYTGRPDPERILGTYDVVFARGRCALEAIAAGCAVILADSLGFGELITPENYQYLRIRNFGRRTYQLSVSAQSILAQLRRYDAALSSALTDLVREREGLAHAAMVLAGHYASVIDEFNRTFEHVPAAELIAASRFLEAIAPTSNTFYLAEQVGPLTQSLHLAQGKLARLAGTLAPARMSGEELTRIRLSECSGPKQAAAGSKFLVSVRVTNNSRAVLASLGEYPINIAYHWLREGVVCLYDGDRTELYPPLPPGASFVYTVEICAPAEPGSYLLRAALVQERVAWLDQPDACCDFPVAIT
ncbi:MAG: glycosyltransferase [Bryobacterales bacterium]|nr:glycosyltransferase [Bryobacterales bacterium]